jgi:hypothetical protein
MAPSREHPNSRGGAVIDTGSFLFSLRDIFEDIAMSTVRYSTDEKHAFRRFHNTCISVLLLCLLTPIVHAGNPPVTPVRIPMRFVCNEGQWPDYVKYMLLPADEHVLLMDDGVVFITKRRSATGTPGVHEIPDRISEANGYDVVIMRFRQPSHFMRIEQGRASGTKANFYLGDSASWRTNVACVEEIIYRNVWDGVDVAFRTDGDGIRTYISDPSASSKIMFEGNDVAVKRLKTSLLSTSRASGDRNSQSLLNTAPQRIPDRLPSDSTYYWTEYASFFPTSKGDSTHLHYIWSDKLSRATIDGSADFPDLPTTPNAWQRDSNIDITYHYKRVLYLGRLRCDGKTPDHLTYYGASQRQFVIGGAAKMYSGAAIRNNKIVFVHGLGSNAIMRERYLPPTEHALDHKYPPDYEYHLTIVSMFDSSGQLAYSSSLPIRGGGAAVMACGFGLDGHVYITGPCQVPFPIITPNTFYTDPGSESVLPFLLKFSPDCDSIIYCTYLPKYTDVIGLDADTAGYVTILARNGGNFPIKNAFQPQFAGVGNYTDYVVARISPRGDSLAFATYLGGSGPETFSDHRSLVVTPSGRSYIAGLTASKDFPLHRPLQSEHRGAATHDPAQPYLEDLVLAGFEPDGSVMFSTYWGGSGTDRTQTMTLTACGDLLLTGGTTSPDFPTISEPAFSDSTDRSSGNPPWRNFMLLFDPEAVEMRASFFLPRSQSTADIALDSAGYLYSVGTAPHKQGMYNGFTPPINPRDYQNTTTGGHGVFRMYFPLCGEDLLEARPLIPDTVRVDSVRQYLSHYEFTLAVELHNRDNHRTAINTRSTIELPFGIVLIEGEPAIKTPVPDIIPPGGLARVEWKLRLDTAKLGGWWGLRDLLLDVKITHEYQLSSALESCLTSFAWSEIPLYVKRKDSEITLVCDVVATDTLRLSEDERGFIPPVITVSGVVTNTGTAPAGPGMVALRLGNMGSHLDPPGDSLRTWPALAPGDSWPVSWTVVPGKRLDPRTLLAEMVVMDEKGSVTTCTESIPIPAIPPLRCALLGPDTVRILKSGELVPPDIFTRILLSNVLDTLVGGAEVELDLLGVTHLRMWPGDTLRKLLGYVMPGGVRDARWQLELAQTPTRPTVVPVTVRYRCDGLRDWSECVKNIVLLPMSSDLLCSITAPDALSEAEVESRSEVKLDYTLRNTGLIPELVDRIDLGISPASACSRSTLSRNPAQTSLPTPT